VGPAAPAVPTNSRREIAVLLVIIVSSRVKSPAAHLLGPKPELGAVRSR
jgi:hypothetical protein